MTSRRTLSVRVSGMAMCAALYAIGSYLTSYIPSPWGVGQFRPAVVVPALFAVVFGSVPAGVGAALGTLIADSMKHGYLYPGSYLSAVPGNFVGFYLFGYITKKFTWGRFVLASNVTLALANLVVAALYVYVFRILYLGDAKYIAFSAQTAVVFVIGLTIWWFVTMLPFVILVTPLLIRVVSWATPSLVSDDILRHSLGEELPRRLFSLALLVPGVVMLSVGLLLYYSAFGAQMVAFFGDATASLVSLMFLLSGVALVATGLAFLMRKDSRKRIGQPPPGAQQKMAANA